MTTALATVTIEEYVESMAPWINNVIADKARPGHAIHGRDDLLQEAKLTLVKVWNKYSGALSEHDLRRCGTRAMYYHFIKMLQKSKSRGRASAVLVTLDGRSADWKSCEHRQDALAGLIIREEIGDVVSAPAAAALLAEDAGMSANQVAAARALFGTGGSSAVGRKVRRRLYRDGYVRVDVENNRHAEGGAMETLTKGPMDPDDEVFSPDKGDAAPPPELAQLLTIPPAQRVRRARASAKKKSLRPRPPVAEAVPFPFAPGEKVTYLGGGRALWLQPGAELVVKGPWTHPSGRLYASCRSVAEKRAVVISTALLSALAQGVPE
jgi:hypothetical protein